MIGTALHVQASIWKHCQVRERRDHGRVSRAVVGAAPGGWWHTHLNHWSHDADLPMLVMAGETAGVEDAFYSAALTRGLSLTTDLDHLDLRPAPGWRVEIDESGALTVEWPHPRPLLRAAPVDLPPGWLDAAAELRLVVVVAGYGLHLSAPEPLAPRLIHAAHTGTLAAGAVVQPTDRLVRPADGWRRDAGASSGVGEIRRR